MIKGLEKRLLAKNIKPTAMRLIVLEFLLKQRAAIPLVEIDTSLAPSDRVTIYRTLKTFEENRMVHSIDDGTGITKYALCADECVDHHHDLHVHFYCTTCNETTCHHELEIPPLELPEGYSLQEVNLIAKGKCNKCPA